MMKQKFDTRSNLKIDQARNSYKKKIMFTLITITIIDIILLLFINSHQTIIVVLLIIAFFITFYSIFFSITGFGFFKRIEYYKKITSILPNGKVNKVIKSLIKEIVIYEFRLNKSKRKMKVEYDIIPGENQPFTILFSYKHPFDLYIGKYPNNDFFETDNKKLLKFEKYLNELKEGDDIKLDSKNQLMKGETFYKAYLPNLIKVMITILKGTNVKGQPILRSDMLNDDSKLEILYKYTVCLHCGKILGKWTRKDKVDIPMCPECFHETYTLISTAFYGWETHIKEKIKRIKELNINE